MRMCHCSVAIMEKALLRSQNKPLSAYIPNGLNTQEYKLRSETTNPEYGNVLLNVVKDFNSLHLR